MNFLENLPFADLSLILIFLWYEEEEGKKFLHHDNLIKFPKYEHFESILKQYNISFISHTNP